MKPVWSVEQVGANLARWNAAWPVSTTISYSFYTSAPAHHGAVYNFSAFSAQQRFALKQIFQLISDVTQLRFAEVPTNGQEPGAGNERIGFLNVDSSYYKFTGRTRIDFTDPAGDERGIVRGSDIEINLQRANPRGGFTMGESNFQTLAHEVLHALGLQHPGEYNGDSGHAQDYESAAQYMQDSTQYTVLSYWAASATGADYFHNNKMHFASTPLLHDIAALQHLYGANQATRAGNTTYGFNNNSGRASYDLQRDPGLIFTIWDGGGRDTLDLSGFLAPSRIDLNEGAFSSSGGLTANISIAHGAVIENAVGGGGADRLIGNAAANHLDGRGGADTLAGGRGDDVYILNHVGDRAFETLGGGIDGVRASIDYVLSAHIEQLALTGAAVNGTGNALDNHLTGNAAHNRLSGLSGTDVIKGGAGGDVLNGGAGADRLLGGAGADIFIFDVALQRGVHDSLPDFVSADDVIRLDRSVFQTLSRNGQITLAEFRLGKAAADASDRIIYDSTSGSIMYDADGVGGAAGIRFALVRPGTELNVTDFQGFV